MATLRIVSSTVVATVAALAAGVLALVAANEILFHAFAPACGSGDPAVQGCGVTWAPGVPALLGVAAAVAVAVLAVRQLRRGARDLSR